MCDTMSALEDALIKVAPSLFLDEQGRGTCFLEVETGWGPLLLHLAAEMHEHIERVNTNRPGSYDTDLLYFDQIKEKNGKLTVYLSMSDPVLNAYIDLAERISTTTCEISGRPGRLCVKNGQYKTLCKPQADRLGFSPVDDV